MSHRKSIYVSRLKPCGGRDTPPWITAEIRLYWPPETDPAEVEKLLKNSFEEALDKLWEES